MDSTSFRKALLRHHHFSIPHQSSLQSGLSPSSSFIRPCLGYRSQFSFEAVPLHVQFLPAKMYDVLPPMEVPAVLMYKGREWKIVYYGGRTKGKRFSTEWKHFVDDNNLRVGDACIFELMACTARKLKLRVQILRGDIPRALQARFHGEGRDHPGVGY